MTRRVQAGILAAIALGAAVWMWRNAGTADERHVRQRLEALAAELNAGVAGELDAPARAGRIGQFFTPDVVIELGQGSPPIHGRDTVIGMALRLQPRTAAFDLEVTDVNVEMLDAGRAETTFTAVIRRRSVVSAEESLDAREFSAELEKRDGDWRLARVVAIDTLR
jgi:hypothetical protein